jgi:hypothetical protein
MNSASIAWHGRTPRAGESSYRGPCRLLGAHITRVTRAGASTVLCDEFCEGDGACRLQLAMLDLRRQAALEAHAPEASRAAAARCLMLAT